jgi:protein tyrosine/serine phosphatase
MSTLVKRTKRTIKRATLGWREAVIAKAPPWSKRLFGPALMRFDSMLIDHGLIRILYLNRHKLGPQAWRAAQPGRHNIKAFAAEGIKTVVNLRGPRVCGSYWLEQQACAKYGVTLVDCQMRSRAAPNREELRRARDLFDAIEYPMVMHCKSGADRVGLMSVLYSHFKLGMPIAQAKSELALRYGHIRQADTGILDHFFECYLAAAAKSPIAFWDWVETVYDPAEVTRTFQANGMATRIVSSVLRRE